MCVFALLGNAYLCKSQSSRVIHSHCSVFLGDLRCPEPTQDALCICPAMNSLFWSQFWRRSLSLLEPLVPVKTLSKLFAESINIVFFSSLMYFVARLMQHHSAPPMNATHTNTTQGCQVKTLSIFC